MSAVAFCALWALARRGDGTQRLGARGFTEMVAHPLGARIEFQLC